MALDTFLDIHVKDHQGQKSTLSFRVKPLALAAAQTLPSAAKIEAVISAIFTPTDSPSNAQCVGYAVRVEEDTPGVTGGFGTSGISSAVKTRNSLDGIPGNWLFSIPGMNKAALSFDATNPNSISTVGTMWDAIRAALADAAIAVSDPVGGYAAVAADEIAMSATGFDGRRSAPRPR